MWLWLAFHSDHLASRFPASEAIPPCFFSGYIIAILAAILFPVFARAREKARQTTCLSNIKQMMLGVHMYAQDYDETMPPGALISASPTVQWYQALEPYLKNTQLLTCPSRKTYPLGYGWNYQEFGYYYASHGTGWATPLGDIDEPAETVLIGDGRLGTRYLYKRSTTYTSRVHNDGGNMGLCDGHAKWYSYSALLASKANGGPWRY